MAAYPQGSALLLLPLILAACSNPATKGKQPNTLILCAAESLYQARVSGVPHAKEAGLRNRADRFTAKLTPKEQQDAWNKIDELADHRTDKPLIDEATCDALLDDADHAALANSAANVANANIAFWNQQ